MTRDSYFVSRVAILALILTETYSFQPHSFSTGRTVTSSRRFTTDAAGAKEALERTAAHLEKLKQPLSPEASEDAPPDPLGIEREKLYREFLLQSANALKVELKKRQLPTNGRKPDLAARLAQNELYVLYGDDVKGSDDSDSKQNADESGSWPLLDETEDGAPVAVVDRFAGLKLSEVAATALGKAKFQKPSPIQSASIPPLVQGESLILHAETGSGKTLAYLLAITEQLWFDMDPSQGYAIILTPTRELAAQVAGIASVLAPPGSVRLVSRPSNLMRDDLQERGELESGGFLDDRPPDVTPRLFIGSAKAIMTSLYGDGKMPAPPTSKPEAQTFLSNVRWLVMDEVDRLLGVLKTRGEKQKGKKRHEKPAAVVCAAIARFTLGKAQIIAASATVGRPLKREVARVLGLPPQDCPRIVRGRDMEDGDNEDEDLDEAHVGRAVTIPDTVENFVVSSDGSSTGELMTAAYKVINSLGTTRPRRILLVLTRGFGINTQNVIGALKHFKCEPEPISLLDALEAQGTDSMIETHRKVSGASGVGGSSYFDALDGETDLSQSYLLVTGEDTVRGLHLDGLDVVLVVGRPNGPDEYTHIAGRTGRAGRPGKVINIVSSDNAASIRSWEKMLGVEIKPISLEDVAALD